MCSSANNRNLSEISNFVQQEYWCILFDDNVTEKSVELIWNHNIASINLTEFAMMKRNQWFFQVLDRFRLTISRKCNRFILIPKISNDHAERWITFDCWIDSIDFIKFESIISITLRQSVRRCRQFFYSWRSKLSEENNCRIGFTYLIPFFDCFNMSSSVIDALSMFEQHRSLLIITLKLNFILW